MLEQCLGLYSIFVVHTHFEILSFVTEEVAIGNFEVKMISWKVQEPPLLES